jgi:hypothetical protein
MTVSHQHEALDGVGRDRLLIGGLDKGKDGGVLRGNAEVSAETQTTPKPARSTAIINVFIIAMEMD